MKRIKSTLSVATLLMAAASLAAASDITFVGVPTGVNDGVYYVTPYEITIDGTPQLVTCYDVFDDVNFGDAWQANILTVDQAATNGYFAGQLAGYKRVAWLDSQTYSNAAQQVGLQHAIWNVFGSSPTSVSETLAYQAAADAAAANAYLGFDFSRFRFVEQTGGKVGMAGTEQAFVFGIQAPTNYVPAGVAPQVAPEPNTFILGLASGMAGLLFWKIRSRRARVCAL